MPRERADRAEARHQAQTAAGRSKRFAAIRTAPARTGHMRTSSPRARDQRVSDDTPSLEQKDRRSTAAQVTQQIADALRNGVKPWLQPWSNAVALSLPLRSNGAPYKGINILVLWAVAQERQYSSPHWFSFMQARELGASVRRGERATRVVYYSGPKSASGDPDAEDATHTPRAFMRSYAVFNASQIEGLPNHYYAAHSSGEPDDTRLAMLFARVPAQIQHGGARAFYNPSTDTIQLPARSAFASTVLYYATLAHELGHWTGAASRLDRNLSQPSTPSTYAKEELVAELTAAFIGAELGLPVEHIECHAAYIDHWIRLLDHDAGALMAAAGRAQAAADLIRGYMLPAVGA